MDSSKDTLLISADSHVIEPEDLWSKRLPPAFREQAPQYPKHAFAVHPGGHDPVERIKAMAEDGVSAEVLYPSLTMDQFGLTDAQLQEACFRVYNDWLIEYCSHSPDRLFGIAAISTYRIDQAIQEAERCKKAGLRGLMVWQVPPDELAFSTRHYEKLWAAAQEMDMPINLHILTGAPYRPGTVGQKGNDPMRLIRQVNMKALYAMNAMIQFIASGVLERFRGLKIVFIENELSWIPFILTQYDKYCARGYYQDSEMKMLPSEYFERQIFATFFNDPPSRSLLKDGWMIDNALWSNDFPHSNSTWPKSR